MGVMNNIRWILLSSVEASSQMGYTMDEVRNSSMAAGEIYLQAFIAALCTLLVMGILWMIIFRPKFKSYNE